MNLLPQRSRTKTGPALQRAFAVALLLALAACGGRPTPAPDPAPTTRPSITSTLGMTVQETATRTSSPVPTRTIAPSATPTALPPTLTPTVTPWEPTATSQPKPTPAPETDLESSVPFVYSMVVTPDSPPLYYAVVANTLFKSLDRGRSWLPESLLGVPSAAMSYVVAVDYRNPQTMYLGTDHGLYRREGNDQPWSLVHTLLVTALAVDLENPDILYAGTGWGTELKSVLVKSEDRGRTWGRADYGLAQGYVSAILINPNNPSVLWAHVRQYLSRSWPVGQVYRGGRSGSWERLSLGQFDLRSYADGPGADACSAAGLTYDPNLNALYTGCDITYLPNANRHYRVLRSLNADSPDSSLVAWELLADWGSVPDEFAGVNTVRPLAVDAREPKALLLFVDLTRSMDRIEYRLMVSHDDGITWEALVPEGLPGNDSVP